MNIKIQKSNNHISDLLKNEEQIMINMPGQPLAVICEAESITSTLFNNLLKQWQSIPYLLLTKEIISRLNLPIVGKNSNGWLMTETIEAGSKITTGISANDRTTTIRMAINPKSTTKDILMPGHILVAVLDDCDSKPASYLYNCFYPFQRPLLWFPVLTDSINGINKNQGHELAKEYKIKYVNI